MINKYRMLEFTSIIKKILKKIFQNGCFPYIIKNNYERNTMTKIIDIKSLLIGFLLAASIVLFMGATSNHNENGRYEALTDFHSWNSDFVLGRLLFHQLTLHSDHHLKASKKYQNLLNLPNAPMHPTGYPGMMLLSFFPPLWFFCMDKLVDEFSEKSKKNKNIL